MNTSPTVIYNHPSGTVRSTIARNYSGFEAKGLSSYEKNETWDNVTQGYRGLINRGFIVNNDYRNRKVVIEQNVTTPIMGKIIYNSSGVVVGDYLSHYNNNPSETTIQSSFSNLDLSTGLNIDYLIDKAVTSLHARISSAPMQALVSLGELKQTIGLVDSLLSRAASAGKFLARVASNRKFRNHSYASVARQLSKGPVANVKFGTASFSKQWLEYRYGIKQLYYDYSAAAKALRALKSPPRLRYSASESSTLSDDAEIALGLWNGMLSHTGHLSGSRSVNVTAGALVQPKASNVGFIQAFGLDEVFQAAWDLTRFSFVVDWFINIGDKIAALAPKLDVNILASWVVVRDSSNYSGYATYVPISYSAGPNKTVYTVSNWEPYLHKRVTETTRLVNPVTNPIPNWDIRLNVGRVTDLLAILRTLPVLR